MEEEDMDIAAAMGFSSFGGTKKRKFDQTQSPKDKSGASGANTTELGARSTTRDQASGTAEVLPDQHAHEEAVVLESTEDMQELKNAKGKLKLPTSAGLGDFLARGTTLPERPNVGQEAGAADNTVSFGGPPISRVELNTLRHGVQDERGDLAFFLPSFVEDPWDMRHKP